MPAQVTSFGSSFYVVESIDDVQAAVDAAVAAASGPSPSPSWVTLGAVNTETWPYTASDEPVQIRAEAVHVLSPAGFELGT